MNLQAEIRPELWDAVAQQYQSQNYGDAILYSFHYLRDILRDTANADGDGTALVGKTLGGNLPRLRINKFETESQQDEQKGFEQILRGMYQGIRNPRTHDKFEDKKETADAIILFLNYTIGIIQKAKGPFALDEWIERVFDPDFVGSERYANLLVAEVPPKRCLEALSTIYHKKIEGDGEKLKLVFSRLVERIGDNQYDELLSIVSDEMRIAQDEATIRRTLQIFPPKLWPRVDEVARLRIENKLIRSVESGKVNSSTRRTTSGALGTWARDFVRYFSLKNEVYQVLREKLTRTEEEQSYVALFFWDVLPHTFDEPVHDLTRALWVITICKTVSDPFGSTILREKLIDSISRFPDNWRSQILDRLKPLEESNPEFYASLTRLYEDDIPF